MHPLVFHLTAGYLELEMCGKSGAFPSRVRRLLPLDKVELLCIVVALCKDLLRSGPPFTSFTLPLPFASLTLRNGYLVLVMRV